MEARRYGVTILLLSTGILLSTGMAGTRDLFAASDRTANFIVNAPSREFATQVAHLAEQYRRDLAIEWLGQELPRWHQPCPISVRVGPNMGAGGATSFMFDRGRPFGWRMSIQGSPERILDSVLPHEVTHTIFATYFGRPLPRWADEGACTAVEHHSEKAKQETMLSQFLRSKPSRGIPFNRMYAMREYPSDIMPLYSQGFSLVRYLLQQGGKRKFVQYLAEGMQHENWDAVTRKYYDHRDLSELQIAWVDWVAAGSPSDLNGIDTSQIAANTPQLPNRREPDTAIARTSAAQSVDAPLLIADARPLDRNPPPRELFSKPSELEPVRDLSRPPQALAMATERTHPSTQEHAYQETRTSGQFSNEVVTRGQDSSNESWYARQRDKFRDSSIFSIGRKTDGRRVAFSSFASLSARLSAVGPPPIPKKIDLIQPVLNLDDPVPPPPRHQNDDNLLVRPLIELGPATKTTVPTGLPKGNLPKETGQQKKRPAKPDLMDPIHSEKPLSQGGSVWR